MSEFTGNIVSLNVGGTIFQTTLETLRKFPDTRLGNISSTSVNYNDNTNQFFFDRSPVLFYDILDMYRTGELHLPSTCCGATIENELKYWRIPKSMISVCCLRTVHHYSNDQKVIEKLHNALDCIQLDYDRTECENNKWKAMMREVWYLIEYPKSSIFAMVYNILYLIIVLLSIVSFMLSFQSDFRQNRNPLTLEDLLRLPEFQDFLLYNHINVNNSKQMLLVLTTPIDILHYIDLFCYIFFTAELVIHFMSCPKKLRFFTYVMNLLDVYLVIIMWITLILEVKADDWMENSRVVDFYIFIKACMILRLLRFLRLVKQYNRLRILFMALQASVQELFLLFLSFLFATTFFASFVYFAEFDEATTFPTIFSGIWWAAVTMTTVGYGDMVPKSTFGYFVGVLCAFFGILILAMPIAIVASNFTDYTQKNNEREMKKSFASPSSNTRRCCKRRHSSKVDIRFEKQEKINTLS